MKKLLHILFFLFVSSPLFADVLLNETFSGAGIPAGWTNTAIQGTDVWLFRSSPAFGSPSGGGYAVFDDQLLGAAVIPNEAVLVTPSVDCSNRTAVYLSYSHHWFGVEFTHGYVEVSNNGGATWTTLKDYHKLTRGSLATSQDTIINITAFAANQANVQVRFRYTDGSQAGRYWYLDDVKIYADPDVGPTQLIRPTTLTCGQNFTATDTVVVRVFNYGVNPISNIPITVNVTGPIASTLTETYTGTIAPQSFIDYQFTGTVNLSSQGLYSFEMITNLVTDEYIINDTLRTAVSSVISTVPWLNDFNVNGGGWTASGTTSWEHGLFTKMNGNAGLGKSWVTHLSGSYGNSETAYLTSPVFDLTNYPDPIIEFDYKYFTEACCDYGRMEYSTDGITWNTTTINWKGNGYTSWNHYADTVKLNNCNLSCVQFRMVFFSDGSVTVAGGFAFDNFQIKQNTNVNDAAAIDLHYNNKCVFGANETIGISVTNVLSNTLCNIPVRLIVTHPTLPTQIINDIIPGPLTQNGRINFTFTSTVDLSGYASGLYTLKGVVLLPGDANPTNDTATHTVQPIITTLPYSENFNAGHGDWVSNGTTNNSWWLNTLTSMGGANGNGSSWITNPFGNYNNSEDNYVTSPIFDFTSVICPYIIFDLKYFTELSADWGRLQSSIDGGATWQIVGAAGDPNWYNSGNAWTGGPTNTWQQMQHSLTSLAGQSCVMLRFLFHSDGSVTRFGGLAFDNVNIIDNKEDVGAIALVSPTTSFCSNSPSEALTVTIQNYGCQAVDSIPVTVVITGPTGTTLTDTLFASVASGASSNFTFTSTVNMSLTGLYNFTIYTSLANDLNVANDTFTTSINVAVPNVGTFPYSENFNITNGGWSSGGTNSTWAYGSFTKMNGSNGQGWVTNLTGNYNNSEDSWVMSPTFNLTTNQDPIVDFDYKYYTESCCDYGRVEFSTNGGATWTAITGNFKGNGFTSWNHFSAPVPLLNCDVSCVLFRFRFVADGSVTYAGGFAFDNFTINSNPDINDAEVVDLHFNTKCTLTNSETVGISVRNLKTNYLCDIPVTLVVTHPTLPTQTRTGTITGPVGLNQRVNYNFSPAVDLSGGPGNYTLTGYVNLTIDNNRSNDTIVRVAYDTISTFPYIENFNTTHGNWVSDANNLTHGWEWTANYTKMNGPQGNGKAWAMYPIAGNYANSEGSWVKSPIFDFSGVVCPIISFDIKYFTEGCCDWGALYSSIDGGATWQKVGTSADLNWYNSNNSWRGGSATIPWQHMEHSLSFLAGQPCVIFRFYFGSDGSVVQNGGMVFDNVEIKDRDFDVSPIALLKPVANKEYCDRRLTDTVQVTVYNNGCSPVTNVPVTINMTGPNSASFTEIIPGPIASNTSVNYTFANTVNMSATGVYTFEIITTLATDPNSANDTLVVTRNVQVYQPIINTYPHIDNFNTGTDNWMLDPNSSANTTFVHGTFTNMGGVGSNGASWATQLSGNYNNSEDDYVLSPIYDFTSLTCPYIDFDAKYYTESCCDYARLYSSIDGGTTWQIVGAAGDPTWYNSGNMWRGGSSTIAWQHFTHSLASLAGQSCVMFRFYFHSDGSVTVAGGFAFDNVRISERDPDVGITALVAPVNNADLCLRKDNDSVRVRVYNFACATITNIPVTVNITGAITTTLTGTVTASIPSNSSVVYTFPTSINMTTIGTYNFEAYTTLGTDAFPTNDTSNASVIVSNYLSVLNTFPYAEDFNAGAGGWQVSNNIDWTLGTFTKMNGNTGFGDTWVTNLSGNYINNENEYVMSPIYDLSSLTCAFLGFDMKYFTESCCDWGRVQYSIDGGTTWLTLVGDWKGNGYANWNHIEKDISFLTGNTCVIFRFYFHSDGSVTTNGGFAFDNIQIRRISADAEIAGVVGCWGSPYHIDVTIRNNNNLYCNPTDSIGNITVAYELNGAVTTQSFSGLNIPPGGTGVVTLTGINIPSQNDTLRLWPLLPNNQTDFITLTDTITIDLSTWPNCNDHCSNAIDLGLGTTTATQTSNATVNPIADPTFAACGAITVENTVWYQFTTNSSGDSVTIIFENQVCSPSQNGIQISIDSATTPCDVSTYANMFCSATNDTALVQYGPVLLPPNTTYYIAVDGFAGSSCNFNITINGAVNPPLPITLLSFDAQCGQEEGTVELRWMSASEINNDFYTIERSTDAQHFQIITTINGAGNSNNVNSYYFKDVNVPNGQLYYRLKQTDFNGNFEYFDIKAVNCTASNTISIYPNPTASNFTLNVTGNNNDKVQLEMYNTIGQKVIQKTYFLTEDKLIKNISVNHLGEGIYFINIIVGNQIETHKLIIER